MPVGVGKSWKVYKGWGNEKTLSHLGHCLRVPLCFGKGQPNALVGRGLAGLSQVSMYIWKNLLSRGLRHRIFNILQTASCLSSPPSLFYFLLCPLSLGEVWVFGLVLSESLLACTALEFSGPVVLESSKRGQRHTVGASAFFRGIPPLQAEPALIWDIFTFSGLILVAV